MNPVPFLFANWKLVGIGLLMVAVAIYIAVLKNSVAEERRARDKWHGQAIEAAAKLKAQNAAIEELRRLSEQRRKAVRQKRRKASARNEKIARVVRSLETAKVDVSSNCPTPGQVLGVERYLSPGAI